MKNAVLFYGRIKNYDTNYANLKKYLGEADFFISHSPELNEDLTDFIKLYQPKIIIDEPIIVDETLLSYPKAIFYVTDEMIRKRLAACINIERVFNSFEKYVLDTNTQYDKIIVTRVDLLYYSQYPFENIVLDNNVIYIPEGRDHEGGMNDQVAVGNINSIKEYCSINKNYKKLLDNGTGHHSETVLKAHLKDKNLIVKRFFLDYIINRTDK